MEQANILFNNSGRLRSGWRVVIFVVVFVAMLFLLTTVARIGYALLISAVPSFGPKTFVQEMIFRGGFLLAALAAGILCNRLLESLPWRAIGIALHRKWLRDFLVGSAIGILSLALAAAIGAIGGGLSFSFSGRELLWRVLQTLAVSAVLFVVAALAEEALFRGYALQTLIRARLFLLGAILTALPFILVHLNNPNFQGAITVINLLLAGIWFAVAYWRTRSLWFPLGIHWAWNWALASLFGLPVSGITQLAPYPLLRGTDLGPAWLTGGDYGIEGGIAATFALILSTFVVWKIKWVNASEEMLRMTAVEVPVSEARRADIE